MSALRFELIAIDVGDWAGTARWAEDNGFSTLVVPDLPAPAPAPFTALAMAAAATSTLEVGTWVLANDFRNPLLVARESATLDLLSGGRFRLGLGAGEPANSYAELGIPADPGRIRVARLAESARLITALFRGERVTADGTYYRGAETVLPPLPRRIPLLIAAGGRRATELAAATADAVAYSTFSAEHLARQHGWLERAAGERAPRIERALRFSTPASTVGPPIPDGAPNLLTGSPARIAEHLAELRERFAITRVVLDEPAARELAPVLHRLSAA